MKEDIAKNLIQKSTISTSDDFTDKLLQKIESEKAVQQDFQHIRIYRFPILGMIGVSVIFFLLIFFELSPSFDIFNFQLKISKTPLMVITTLMILLGASHMLKMQQLVNFYNKN